MELYVIIGFATLAGLGALWVAWKWGRVLLRSERAEARADAHDARADRLEAIRQLERDLEDHWDGFRPTTERTIAPPSATDSTKIIVKRKPKSGGALALMACALLALSTGCTRTVYVDAPLPVIPVGPEIDPNWDRQTLFDYATRLRAVVERYNEEATRGED